MYIIIWEYQVKPERISEFEQSYHSQGAWAHLFHKHKGYIGTELLRDSQDRERYMTIDRWASIRDYESFLSQWRAEYDALDAQYEGLTEQETMLGRWETIDHKTR